MNSLLRNVFVSEDVSQGTVQVGMEVMDSYFFVLYENKNENNTSGNSGVLLALKEKFVSLKR